ncbi:hypothetical protein DVH24_023298 [Malus domestica]|uniref:Uncharacterized protein n=1 Tax=Malus domestica TaxID=3750 RepID=A0A498KNK8_MALDO|nr:hypothetical protein DVH24_023298 [Malus domestica]
MWNLISNRRPASRGSQIPSPGGSAIATSTPDVTTTAVPQVMPLGSTVYMALASSTSSVMHPILSAQQTHRRPWSSEEAQQSGEASFVHEKGSHTGKLALYIYKLASSFIFIHSHNAMFLTNIRVPHVVSNIFSSFGLQIDCKQ